MNLEGSIRPQNRLRKLRGICTGAAGGFFGPLTSLAELPITTTLILRSIANIARTRGNRRCRYQLLRAAHDPGASF